MARFRLVAADLDGTLLDPEGNLSMRTIAAVRALGAAGVTLVLATSRRLTGAAPVAEALGIAGPLILYDGAQTREHPSGAILEEHPLPAPIARRAVAILARHQLRPIVQHADRSGERLIVGPAPRASHIPSRGREQTYLDTFSHQLVEVSAVEQCVNGLDPLRVVAFATEYHLRAAAAEIATLPAGWQLLPTGNYGTAELSVFGTGASKGAALLELAARLRIPHQEIFAIGDGINDVAMLKAAGFGVAMANGGLKVRAVAQAIAPSHAEDGVAWAIERFVLDGRQH